MLLFCRQAGLDSQPAFYPSPVCPHDTVTKGRMTSLEILNEEDEEHEEGEISDEEPSPPSPFNQDQSKESSRVEHEVILLESAKSSASDRDAPLLQRLASLDELIELGPSIELKATAGLGIGPTRKRTDSSRGWGELDSSAEEESSGSVLKRNGRANPSIIINGEKQQQPWPLQQKQPLRDFSPSNGVYGASLYNFAWAQAVSGRPSFSHSAAGESSSMESSPRLSADGLISSLSPGMGSWSVENRKLSKESSHDLETFRRSVRSSEERDDDDMSPLRDNGSRGERGSSERLEPERARRFREPWAEKSFQIVRSRVEKSERGVVEGEQYHRGVNFSQADESRKRKQRSESPSANGRDEETENGCRLLSEVYPVGQNDEKNFEAEEKEDGELEEGEIELGSLPSPSPDSTPTTSSDSNRQSKYNGNKTQDYWSKEKLHSRYLSSKSQIRTQIDDYSSRKQRPSKSQESLRERRLFMAADLVKNVTVKDAQKSFVDVCSRLQKALRLLDELRTENSSTPQDGRPESPPRDITTLARQAFAGIRAVYAVRNTASGREQERDKDIFPRLLELASGDCQKLFTVKQRRELDAMMQSISTPGRLVRDGSEKSVQSATKRAKDNDFKHGDSHGKTTGNFKLPVNSELKNSLENGMSGRTLAFADTKQVEEAAAIAAAALAYAQNSASARASSLYSSTNDNRSNGVPVAGKGSRSYLSENSSQIGFSGPGLNLLQPNTGFNITKYQPWGEAELRKEECPGHSVEVRAIKTLATGSSLPDSSEGRLTSSSTGYSKNDAYGIEDDCEELRPAGAMTSGYIPSHAASVKANGVKEDYFAWPLRPEIRTALPYQINTSATAPSLYAMENLPSPTRSINNGLSISSYSGDQLPSPTHPGVQGSTLQYSTEQMPSSTHSIGTASAPYVMDRLPSTSLLKNRVIRPVYSMEQLPSPTHQGSRGTGPQFFAEQLAMSSQPKTRGTAPVYAVERLPSPTPGECEDGDDGADSGGHPKPFSLDTESRSSAPLASQSVGKLPATILSSTPNHELLRSRSLEASVPQKDEKIDKESSVDVIVSPFVSKSFNDGENYNVPHSFPLNGTIRSRDPRRRFQNLSLDSADATVRDGNIQMSLLSNWNLGDGQPSAIDRNRMGLEFESDDLQGSIGQLSSWNPGDPRLPAPVRFRILGDAQPSTVEKNRKRIASEMDDLRVVGEQKRSKGVSDSTVDTNSLYAEEFHTPLGTGGWLDDNVVSPSPPAEDIATTMEVDEEGGATMSDLRIVAGTDPIAEDDKFDVVRDSSITGVSGKQQMTDLSQQIVESGQRRMKPRDPRRALIEGHLDRNESSLIDLPINGTAASSTGESVAAVRITSEQSPWSNADSLQASMQGTKLPNIAPNFMEKLTTLVGLVGSAPALGPPSQNKQILTPGGADGAPVVVLPRRSTVPTPGNGEAAYSTGALTTVTSESLAQEPPEKSTVLSTGSRKPKGNPSQWGASQLHPGLEQLLEEFSEEERRSVQLERKRRMEEQDRMFSAGKLCLVLDLDHTLLNSAKFSEIEPEWEQRLRVAESADRNRTNRDGLERRELYRFPHMSMWTKLRPGIWKFLARASQLFELHVYTMGNKVYATEMAKLLDPTGKLFAGRVISKGDDGDGDDLLPKSKDLDGVLGMESAVVIIDDSARVWPHHSHNLIVVERYMYFPCSRRQFGLAGPSLLEVGHDERETDGMLASALGVVDRIHQRFFQNERLNEIDVREILADQQRQVLAGCRVIFSRVFPVGEAEPHRHPLWRSAEQFGATCTIAIDDQVTHVVAISLGTDKVNWAHETGRYVVRPAWLEASTILYRRANERDFPVLPQLA